MTKTAALVMLERSEPMVDARGFKARGAKVKYLKTMNLSRPSNTNTEIFSGKALNNTSPIVEMTSTRKPQAAPLLKLLRHCASLVPPPL